MTANPSSRRSCRATPVKTICLVVMVGVGLLAWQWHHAHSKARHSSQSQTTGGHLTADHTRP